MLIKVLQENLLRALSRTGRIVSTKPQLPIVQNVLLSAEGGRLRATTTNLETAETVWVGAKVEKEGGICVSSRLFTELVTSLPQETVSVAVKEGAMGVRCGSFSATLPGVAASEFPPVTPLVKKGSTAAPKEKLLAALNEVLFAAATDEGRPLLTGVRFYQKEGELVLAATDGYRLSVKKTALVIKDVSDAVVPARALAEAVKVAQEEKDISETNFVGVGEGQLGIIIGDTEITTRLIAGEYPNFEKIIPTKYNTRVLLDKERLGRAVRTAAIFARDSANIIKLNIERQRVIISANAPQVGESQVEVETKVDGEGGEIAFNSRFLMEFLANLPEEELLFEMTGSLNPGVFRPVKDESYLHIIMPVRVQS